MDFVGGTIDVFGSFPDIVVDPRKLGLAHPVGPHDPGAKPLRMVDQEMKRRPLDGNARSLEPDTQLSENIVNEALVARVVCQPVHDVAVRMRGDGSMFGGAFISCSRAVTWIDGTGYVVSPLDSVKESAAACLRASGCRRVAACPARERATVALRSLVTAR